MDSLEELKAKVKQFNFERDWDQYHNPKDLVVALFSEVGELAECYRWLNNDEISSVHQDENKHKMVEEEVADILLYLITFSYKTGIDLIKVVEDKLEKNKLKYPIEKMKGIHSNPLTGFKGKELNNQ